jgi:2-oxoglutarate/2-oxoacid ferredoxin oxidoreductase subunit beta
MCGARLERSLSSGRRVDVKAAIVHEGSAFINAISPYVSFNNHAGSTKSYDYVREHNEAVNRLDFWPTRESISANYAEGEVIEVPAGAEGGILRLRKLHADYDPSDKINATSMIASATEVLTGLLYLAPDADDMHGSLNPTRRR